MANKDFKVKNGLVVGQDLNVSGVIKLNDTTVIDSSGKYTGVDSDILSYLSTNNYATQAYVDSAINGLIDAAPDQLNTLNELSQALNNDSDFAGTITQLIGTKANAEDVAAQIDSATVGILNTVYELIDSSAAVTLETTKQLDGTTTAIASGELPSGQVVTLNSDGTVSVVQSTVTPHDVPLGSSLTISVNAYEINAQYIPGTTDKILITYKNGSDAKFYGVVGTILNNNISIGTAYQLSVNNANYPAVALDPNNPGKFILVYSNQSASNYGIARVGTISGSAISLGTETPVISSNYVIQSGKVAFDPIVSGQFVLAFTEAQTANPDSKYGSVVAGNVSGTTISFGTKQTYAAYQTGTHNVVFAPGTNNFIISHNNNVDGARHYFLTASVDASNFITIGTATKIIDYYTSALILKFNTDTTNYPTKFILTAGTDNGAYVVVGEFSGGSLVTGTPVQYSTDNYASAGVGYYGEKAILLWNETTGGTGEITSAIVSGNSISLVSQTPTQTIADALYSDPLGVDMDPNRTDFAFVYTYRGLAGSLNAAIGRIQGDISTTLTDINFIGFSADSYSDGDLATIKLTGSITKDQTGLTTGSLYYVAADGSLVLSPGNPAVFAGIAIDSDKLEVGAPASLKLITNTIDSAYIQARQADIFRDSGFVTDIIDSAYIQARQVDLVRDSAFITNVIDAAYIQANQVDIFRNSAFVTDIVDAAYIQARDRIRDSNFVTDIIDSAYINSKVIIPDAGVDSAAIIGIIDSAYIQARSPAINSIGDISDVDTTTVAPLNGQALIWDSSNSVWSPGTVATSGGMGTVDSAQTIALITDTVDSAYIQARQIVGGSGTVDSAIVTAIVAQEFTAQDRISQTNFKFVADSNQTVFTGLDVNNNTLLIDSSLVTVSVNGVILINGEDYTTTSSSITLQYNANFGDEIYVNTLSSKANISINSYGFSGLDNYIFVADSGQTIFTGYDRDSNLLSLTEGLFSVTVNGIRLLPSDYSSTETTLTLNDARLAQDEVLITQYGFTSSLPISALSTFYYTADSGQTVFTGADNNGNTLSYKAGSIQAYLNGIYLIPTVDYTATNGSSFTLTSAAESSAELVINSIVTAYTQGGSGGTGTVDSAQTIALITDTVDSAYINARVTTGGSGTIPWTEITDSSSILSNSKLIVNTSVKPITLTFPATPSLGDEIKIIDGSGNAYINNITIDLNGNNINGISDDLLIDYDRASITLLYYNPTQGWIISEK